MKRFRNDIEINDSIAEDGIVGCADAFLEVKLMKQVVKRLQVFVKAKTWLEPKHIGVLILTSIIGPIILGLTIVLGNLFIERWFKSSGVSITYHPVVVLSTNDLEAYTISNKCFSFKHNLDDTILSDYFVVPITLRNVTRNPIDSINLRFDAECSYAKIVDVSHAKRFPKTKHTVIQTDLPSIKWQFITNDMSVVFGMAVYPAQRQTWWNVYCSLVPDRGFGLIERSDTDDNKIKLRFPANSKPTMWHTRVSVENIWGETKLEDSLPVPNPMYKLFLDTNGGNPSETSLLGNKSTFSSGITTIRIESGLDSKCELDLYILGKAAPGQVLTPKLSLEAAPGINCKEVNVPAEIVMPNRSWADIKKRKTMPKLVKAIAASEGNVITWDVSDVKDYIGIRIFRSPERALGDFADIGTEVFAGYGNTNSFELTGVAVKMAALPKDDLRDLDTFIASPPNSKNFVIPQPSTFLPETNQNRPASPGNLQLLFSEIFSNNLHFLDKPPATDSNYTYTVYINDSSGTVSYPVVANLVRIPIVTNLNFHRPPRDQNVIRLPSPSVENQSSH